MQMQTLEILQTKKLQLQNAMRVIQAKDYLTIWFKFCCVIF